VLPLPPRTGIETTLVENMAISLWRQSRLLTLEIAGINSQMRKQAEMRESADPDPATCANMIAP
jgi:hypothetical protein